MIVTYEFLSASKKHNREYHIKGKQTFFYIFFH